MAAATTEDAFSMRADNDIELGARHCPLPKIQTGLVVWPVLQSLPWIG